MDNLTREALRTVRALARRASLNEFENQLYEACSRYAATVLNFQDAISQSALIEAERELDEHNTRDCA